MLGYSQVSCKMCSESYGNITVRSQERVPMMLICRHSFCSVCLSKAAANRNAILCPTCKAVTNLRSRGSTLCLPVDIYSLGLVYLHHLAHPDPFKFNVPKFFTAEEARKKERRKTLIFDMDDEDEEENKFESCCRECLVAKAKRHCRQCKIDLCEACHLKVHSASRHLNQHQSVEIGSKTKLGHLLTLCEDHGKPRDYFCDVDRVRCCADCVVLSDAAHFGHPMTSIEEQNSSALERLKAKLPAARAFLGHLKKSEAVLEKISPMFSSVNSRESRLPKMQALRQQFMQLHSSLQIREIELLRQINAPQRVQSSTYDTVLQDRQEVEEILQVVKEAISSNFSCEIHLVDVDKELSNLLTKPCLYLSSADSQCQFEVENMDEVMAAIDGCGVLKLGDPSGLQKFSLAEIPEEHKEVEQVARVRRNKIDIASRVNVTHMSSPDKFFLYSTARHDELMNFLRECTKGAESGAPVAPESCRPGELMFGKYTDEKWYRARILPREEGQDGRSTDFLVQFVDFGNNETLPLGNLRCISAELAAEPPFVVPCRLHDVQPFRTDKWSHVVIKYFESLLINATLVIMKIGEFIEDTLEVQLGIVTDVNSEPISVGETLIHLKMAQFYDNSALDDPIRLANSEHFLMPDCEFSSEDTAEIASITHINSPSDFYVQCEADKDVLRLLTAQIQKFYSSSQSGPLDMYSPVEGMFCAARNGATNSWCRGQVESIVTKQLIRVRLIDFGCSAEVKWTNLKHLPAPLKTCPPLAWPCRLVDVSPFPGGEEWSRLANSMLRRLLGRALVLYNAGRAGQPGQVCVVLFERFGNDEEINVNALLVSKKCAVQTGERASASFKSNVKLSDAEKALFRSRPVSSHRGRSRPLQRRNACNNLPTRRVWLPVGQMINEDGTPVPQPDEAEVARKRREYEEELARKQKEEEDDNWVLPTVMPHVPTVDINELRLLGRKLSRQADGPTADGPAGDRPAGDGPAGTPSTEEKLPDLSTMYKVTVLGLSNPDDFHIMRSPDGVDRLIAIEKKLEAAYRGKESLTTIVPKMDAVLRDDSKFYRVEILELFDSTAQVFLKDYARVKTCPLECLYEMLPETAQEGSLTVRCHVHGLRPTGGSKWSIAACEYFRELTELGHEIYCDMKSLCSGADDSVAVNLMFRKVCTRYSQHDEPNFIDLQKSLIHEGFAFLCDRPNVKDGFAGDSAASFSSLSDTPVHSTGPAHSQDQSQSAVHSSGTTSGSKLSDGIPTSLEKLRERNRRLLREQQRRSNEEAAKAGREAGSCQSDGTAGGENNKKLRNLAGETDIRRKEGDQEIEEANEARGNDQAEGKEDSAEIESGQGAEEGQEAESGEETEEVGKEAEREKEKFLIEKERVEIQRGKCDELTSGSDGDDSAENDYVIDIDEYADVDDEEVLQAGDEEVLQAGDEEVLQAGDEEVLQAGDEEVLQAGDEEVLKVDRLGSVVPVKHNGGPGENEDGGGGDDVQETCSSDDSEVIIVTMPQDESVELISEPRACAVKVSERDLYVKKYSSRLYERNLNRLPLNTSSKVVLTYVDSGGTFYYNRQFSDVHRYGRYGRLLHETTLNVLVIDRILEDYSLKRTFIPRVRELNIFNAVSHGMCGLADGAEALKRQLLQFVDDNWEHCQRELQTDDVHQHRQRSKVEVKDDIAGGAQCRLVLRLLSSMLRASITVVRLPALTSSSLVAEVFESSPCAAPSRQILLTVTSTELPSSVACDGFFDVLVDEDLCDDSTLGAAASYAAWRRQRVSELQSCECGSFPDYVVEQTNLMVQNDHRPFSDPKDLVVGLNCVCRFEADGNFYRATVHELRGKLASVTFIDFGNREWVNAEDVYCWAAFVEVAPTCGSFRLHQLIPPWHSPSFLTEDMIEAHKMMVDLTCAVTVVRHADGVSLARVALPNGEGAVEKIVAAELGCLEGYRRAISRAVPSPFRSLALPLGQKIPCVPSHFSTPRQFYLQPNNAEVVTELAQELQQLAQVAPPFPGENVRCGAACIVKWTVDRSFYRAEVLRVLRDSSVIVHFVDYGNLECVPRNSLLQLSGELQDIPAQSVACELHGVELQGAELQGAELQGAWWTVATCDGMRSVLSARQGILARFQEAPSEYYGSSVRTELFDRSDESSNLAHSMVKENILPGATVDDACSVTSISTLSSSTSDAEDI